MPFDAGADGADGEAPDAAKPDDCNETADAISPEAKGCAVDSFALFVDGEAGDDANDGSRAKPLKKIGSAIAQVGSTGKRRIYVCGAATYAEHLSVKTAVNLYGGFACASWEPDANAKPKVAPSDKGYALHVDDVSAPIVVSDLELSAMDAGSLEDGTSSIAVFVNKAELTLLRTTVRASNGAKGAAGADGVSGAITSVSSGTNDAVGNSGSGATGGLFKECTCSTSTVKTLGGVGGANGGGGGNGEPSYGASAPKNGAGGIPGGGTCSGDGPGKDGANAPPAANAEAPTTHGTLAAEGWQAAKGADATENGKPGQGGGGGGAINTTTGGSGGGCGGCGGFAGKGSGGGGASIALLVHESTVAVKASTLETKAGGAGGIAGAGGAGLSGGIAGLGQCLGGRGGDGANGGAGAGGAGGVSIGVLYKGTAPVLDDATTVAFGAVGAGGKGGKSPDNDGPGGVAEKTKDASQL
ncbi:MAG: hypothetical protein KF764_34115 [Labilithrix sp.]|nr:hypothetical protein [Labilithrix sp.]